MIQPFLTTKKIVAGRTVISGGGKTEKTDSSASKAEKMSTKIDEPSKQNNNNNSGTPTTEDSKNVDEGRNRSASSERLDALFAAAREEFDLDLTPVESAVKTFR